MSTTTPYLGLVLYDNSGDQSVTFATFRAVWGGTATTSNFYKIDTNASSLNSRITALEGASGATAVGAVFISANLYEATGISGITSYNPGMLIILSIDTTSDGTVTLNINSLGVKSVMKVNSSGTPINLTGSDLVVGRQYLFIYDGTRWLWVSANSADQIQIVGTSGNVVTVGSTNNLLGTTTQSALISATISSATEKTTPVGADMAVIADSEASNVTKKVSMSNWYKALGTGTKNSSTFLRGDGTYASPLGTGTIQTKYIISPSISSDNLVFALKYLDGNDPTSTNKLTFRVGNTEYDLTTSMSFTKNAGTNWGNLGNDELKTLPHDLFAYAIGETGGSAGLKFGWSRVPFATTMNDFVNTTTSPYYIAGNWTNFNASDAVTNIGRFRVQLSGGAGYTWSIPSSVVVNRPIYESDLLNYTPVASANGSMTYTDPIITTARYKVMGKQCYVNLFMEGTTGGTLNNSIQASPPFVSLDTTFVALIAATRDAASGGSVIANGGYPSGTGSIFVRKGDNANFTAGTGRVIIISGVFGL